MQQLPVSVVVVSRCRPDSLRLCLTGLARLLYRNYEIILVADPAGVAVAAGLPFAPHLTIVPFNRANISAGRNLGISAAAGEVVAFIDDDAVPEPAWLTHLAGVFHDDSVAAAGGFVIGRNGISYQWKARSIDPDGEAHPLPVNGSAPVVLSRTQGRAIKTEGTNMAIRRNVLQRLGGFDEAFRFYLDETDLNMRLAKAGQKTAIVPAAVVHHAYGASPRRRHSRAVLDLTDIGRSSVLFWRKHAAGREMDDLETRLIAQQRRRVVQQMRDGLLNPDEVRHVLQTLANGLAEGRVVPPDQYAAIAPGPTGFRQFPTLATGQAVSLSGGVLGRAALQRCAGELAAKGHTVSLYLFSHTALYHRASFTPDGYWLQRGGLFGRSERQGSLVKFWRRSRRVQAEEERVYQMRHGDVPGCR
ncbi:glycosyltransferase family 2 protein [Thalassovita sp.]|uniref:glycosyltransferase family 2 protein n=1 Tax=Thalassovita sp. TaxID=1979401 RepID=UPI0029DE60DB|nr:glycosyltransferase family 2 protein [Thalassovita sp.]